MISGTYREWCNDGSYGEFIYTHPDGTERHIQVTLGTVATTGEEREYYTVEWTSTDPRTPEPLRDITIWCLDEFEVADHPDKLVEWDTVGEVIDG